ncbi:MAG: winged helix-turn-helix domain-containing protein [Proteobacteria bacterium]|nr:winged helix-turn-helix domain-containing protein [Pseudomonadota bacterium]
MTAIKIRIDFDGERYIGHGRIQLLELIGEHGSIAQAAKAMGMSYKRAWYLMDEFNSMFADPLIERQHGGRGGGAAKLTPFGADLVRQYRYMEEKVLTVFAKPLASIEKHLAAAAKPGQKAGKKASPSARA